MIQITLALLFRYCGNLCFFVMPFESSSLDLSMRTLLIHALRSEAALIRQHYPLAPAPVCANGIELRSLTPELDLLRTGLGLEKTAASLALLPSPGGYGRVIHFGVSGSLNSRLAIGSLIQGHDFRAVDQPMLTPATPDADYSGLLRPASFISVLDPVQDEETRQTLQTLGCDAVDMESYAVARFCTTYTLPLLAVRSISDRAGSSTAQDFKQHFSQAASLVQAFLLEQIMKKK